MAVLHKTAAYVLLLLLYLHVPGTAPHALPQHPNSHGTGGEVHASLQDNTLSPVQSAAIPHIAENDALTDASNSTSASSTPREHLEHPESTPDASTSTSSPRERQHPESTPDASTLTSSPREHLEHPVSTSDASTSSPREHLEHPVSTLDASTSASSPREHREHPESTQDRTWKEKEQRNYLGRQTKLKENMTQMMKIESSGGKDDATTSENDKADAGLRQEEKVKGVISSGGWFTDTLNVTLRPVVTWMRRPASPRHPSTLRKEERKDKEEDVEEERRGREGEDDILLTVTFLKEDQPLILDLHPTWDLLAASYTESSGGGGDTLLGERAEMICEYQGVVRGREETWVALSVCGGLNGVVAATLEGGEEVELLVEALPGTTSALELHRVFSANLLKLPESFCGVKDTDPSMEAEGGYGYVTMDNESMITKASVSPPSRARRWVGLEGNALWYQRSTRFVELVLVADYSYYTKYGAKTYSRCKALVNIVNALYRPLGVVVVLSHVEVWSGGDKIHVTSHHSENLNQFKKYRRQMLDDNPHYNNDNTMLLTAVRFQGTTVGFAVVGGMCGVETSTGVVLDKQDHVGVVAYTLSHEMGHNFGMKHDDDKNNGRRCRCDTHNCIMGSSGSGAYKPHISWSSCSRQLMEKKIDSNSLECLRNVPPQKYPSSSCGDGVVDEGEQCDSGPAEFRANPCCLAATCTLAANASCASGPCCDTKRCQVRAAGVVCRESFTQCDLPEFCSGDSESCPEDVTKADGTLCHEGQGHCYEAKCGSHVGRCQAIWGPSTRVASHQCYLKLNTRGRTNGNCGPEGGSKTDWLPCAKGDHLCGSAQCLPVDGAKPQANIALNFGMSSAGRLQCAYIVSEGVPPWYYLTPDGAKCADGKMCVNKRCVKVPPPSGHCRDGCSGRGVCNSRGHCHCDAGWAPPHCDKEGEGGSIDSGRIGRGYYKDPAWEALFIVSLIALGAAIALCCLWSHVRRWWEARGRASTPPRCASCLDACCCPLMAFITERVCTKKKNKDKNKKARTAWEQEKMISQADHDLKDGKSHTKPWDAANKRLLTEVATTTPKTTGRLDRPSYMQSVSVDSGCIPDEEDTAVHEPLTPSMSMKSLVSVFKNFGTRSSPPTSHKGSTSPQVLEHQRRMPSLHRSVVDPLAGSRRSRHGTPPPDHVRQEWRRSVSLDTQPTGTGRPSRGPPPPPLATEKPHNTNDESPQVCRAWKQRVLFPPDVRPHDNGQVAFLPGNKNPSVPSPSRPAPKTPSTPPAAPPSGPRKPMMPPDKKQISVRGETQSKNKFATKSTSPVKATQQKGKASQNSPPKRPLLPPTRGPERPLAARLPKASAGFTKPRPAGDVPASSTTGGRVKELAKKLEKP